MFIAAPTEYFAVKSEQENNGTYFSYCNEFYGLEVFFIFLRFEQGSRPFESVTGNARDDLFN